MTKTQKRRPPRFVSGERDHAQPVIVSQNLYRHHAHARKFMIDYAVHSMANTRPNNENGIGEPCERRLNEPSGNLQ